MWVWQPSTRLECLPSSTPLSCSVARGVYTLRKGLYQVFVPVVDSQQQPLMPTTPARARRWIKSGMATPYWKGGVFCVRLNREPSARVRQPIAVGIDPGSQKEGYSVVSAAHTYLNIQADTPQWVKEALAMRRQLRRTRRGRKTPYRQPRANRLRNIKRLPPSTKARWQWKLRLAHWLSTLYPVTLFVVEDIKARTAGKRRWDQSFSPLEVGKQWFYQELRLLASVETRQGWETKRLRDDLGLKKSRRKLAAVWVETSAQITRAYCCSLLCNGIVASSIAYNRGRQGGESPMGARFPLASSVAR
jgi:hypothetical protein